MRTIIRFLGWLILCSALAMLAVDAWFWLNGARRLTAAAELWSTLDARFDIASLSHTQSFTQRYLFPWLWDPMMAWVLLQPAVAVLGVLGLAMAWLAKR